jgi:GNAT superfamily N-acetyltransferase
VKQSWPSAMTDTHVHTSPDWAARLMDDDELAQAADAAGYRAVVLKSHHTVTAARATLAQKRVSDVQVLGGVVLNLHATGGINPYAVEAALKLGGRVVWLPTFTSANQVAYGAQHGTKSKNLQALGAIDGPGIRVIDDHGAVVPDMCRILDLMAEAGATLATGHVSGREIMAVVPEARRRGVPNVLVTHPELSCVGLSIEDQLALAELDGVWFERVFALTMATSEGLPVSTIAEAVRTVGVGSTVMASDFGQAHNVSPVTGLQQYVAAMRDCGFTHDEVELMTVANPARALSLG